MAGVSTATVSFVLNGKKGVSDSTREKIQQLIDETGFVPDNKSRRFYFNKNYTVTLVSSQKASVFDDIFYYEVVQGLDYRSGALGYNVIFTSIRKEDEKLILPNVIHAKDTDGLVFLHEIPVEVHGTVQRLGIPCVIVDAPTTSYDFTVVYTDYYMAAYRATRYLIDHGHKAIAFFGPSRAPVFHTKTFLGYKKAMEEIHVPIPFHWIQSEANDDESTCQALDKLLEDQPAPTAIFCATDMIAIAAMNHARKKGLHIPHDLSFIGIDDVMISKYVYPPLTTVRVDKFEMGRVAMDLLIKKINNEEATSQLVESGEIVERDSVRNLKQE